MAEEEEEVPWQIDLRHVEVEEQKSPSPEEKEKAPLPEFERIAWTPYQRRDRPEVRAYSGTHTDSQSIVICNFLPPEVKRR